MKRFVVIVLDGFGMGAMADAATDNTREYVILSGISLGSLAASVVAATFLRRKRA